MFAGHHWLHQRKHGKAAVSLRWVMLLGLCGSFQACALLGWQESPPESAARPAATPHRASKPEAHRFSLAKEQDVVGSLMSLQLEEGDTLPDAARHYGLGYEDIAAANPGIDPWVPKNNAKVLVPIEFVLPRAPRKGLVINLAAMRLFHFPSSSRGTEVITYPVGIGKEGKSTPTGPLSIQRKKEHPTWVPTANIRADHARKGDPLPAVVSPGPDNPLGDFAMYLSRQPYLIHGTNKPYSIGWRASNGCIRLYPENIEQLFPAVPVREPVLIVNQPYLFGWRDGLLYLEAHRPQEELSEKTLQKRLRGELKKVEKEKNHPLDWGRVDRVLAESRGIATPVSAQGPSVDAFLAHAQPLAHPRKFLGAPEAPQGDTDGWQVLVDETVSEDMALRLTAFLNHQGPQIPARTEPQGDRYRVIAGPYENAKAAKAAVKRLQVELELDGKVMAPAAEVAGKGGRVKSKPENQAKGSRKPSDTARSPGDQSAASAAAGPRDLAKICESPIQPC